MCDHDIATNFDVVVGEVILVDSCVCTVISICCDYYYFFLKKNRIFSCGGTVQNKFFGKIRYRPFVF